MTDVRDHRIILLRQVYFTLHHYVKIFSHLVGLSCPDSEIFNKLFKNESTVQCLHEMECLSPFPV